MRAKDYIIAIDSGTQSIRAVLFDRHGTQIALEQAEYEPFLRMMTNAPSPLIDASQASAR